MALTADEKAKIIERRKQGGDENKPTALAKEFGVSVQYVSQLTRGKTSGKSEEKVPARHNPAPAKKKNNGFSDKFRTMKDKLHTAIDNVFADEDKS